MAQLVAVNVRKLLQLLVFPVLFIVIIGLLPVHQLVLIVTLMDKYDVVNVPSQRVKANQAQAIGNFVFLKYPFPSIIHIQI